MQSTYRLLIVTTGRKPRTIVHGHVQVDARVHSTYFLYCQIKKEEPHMLGWSKHLPEPGKIRMPQFCPKCVDSTHILY
jgi:hypothetical protein